MYYEMRSGDIVSRIKDRQCKFYEKLKEIPTGDAIVLQILDLCRGIPIIDYYEQLHNQNVEDDISNREERIRGSTASMVVYYLSIVTDEKSCIYSSLLCDKLRYVITRWRLSNHDLEIEKGRRRDIPRELRVCDRCETLEDEDHVIFHCPRYEDVRQNHREFLQQRHNIELFLNPTFETAVETANFIREVEALRKR